MKFYRLASGFPTKSGSLLPTKRGRELPTLTTLFYISENNIIYLESLIPNSVIIQDAQAITPITFYALSSEKFFQIVRPELPAFEAMFSHFLNRIILLHEYILCSHFRESSKRVAYLLYATYKHSGPVIPIPTSK